MTQDIARAPFRITISPEDLDDLRHRLARTRWPLPVPGRGDRPDFRRGMSPAYLAELAEHWHDGFDWREQEARLAELPQLTTVVDGQTFHLVHVRSEDPEAMPLLLLHGWPGSFLEYRTIIPLLTEAFHVVIPSPPGFGFSTPLAGTGWELARTADAYAEIMTRLGYRRFLVHGTDMGTGIAGRLAGVHPRRVIGMHLGADRAVLGLAGDLFPAPEGLAGPERRELETQQAISAAESGYRAMHSHRPDTIGPSLTDSPIGLLAWIAEKYKTRSGDGFAPPAIDRDLLLSTVSLYWFTRSGASSAQFSYEFEHSGLAPVMAAEVPSGWAVFDAHPLVRRVLDPQGAIGHWSEFARGGHFPAAEVPELLAADLRSFARSIS
ncbi:epoxide hydrolase family protein [Brachybacterium phenoliresistens]|uniref:epoxide hydrolase family protein n=1 Tax=Brachybacterium phenoliresistens TaxID=396014 RepID=UPI0031D9AE65